MYPATESGRSESGPFVTDDYFSLLFSLEEHQLRIIPHASECIRTVAATYSCKTVYVYDANVYGYDATFE